MTTILPMVKARFDDSDGTPLAGGSVEFLEAGSSTPKDTFKDLAGTILNTNPVILDTRGEAEIRLGDGLYKVIVKDSAGVIQHTIDDVSVLGSVGAVIDTVNSIAALKALSVDIPPSIVEVLGYFNPPGDISTDPIVRADAGGGLFYFDSDSTDANDDGVTIIPDSTPATGRWVRIFDGPVSIKWFGAVGDYLLDSGAKNGTPTNNTTPINNTLIYARANDLAVKVPAGGYFLTGAIDCAVQMIGDQKPRIDTNEIYAAAGWTTATDFDGCFFIWDNTALTTSSVYIRNVSGDDSNAVKFKNIGFMSQSSGADGGGTLLEIDTPAATTKYDFGDLPPFEDCYILNFKLGIKTETFRGLNINNVEFRGCQRAALLGIIITDLSEQISFNECLFKKCGDASTSFIQLEAVHAIYFNQCIFDTTSQIEITLMAGIGLLFSECYYLNQKNASGVGGGTFAFLQSNADVGAGTGNISLYKTQGGTDAGDIDLSLSPTAPKLTLIDSDLKTAANGSDLILGDAIVTELGAVNFGTITTTGLDNKFTTGGFQSQGIKFDTSGIQRQIKLLTIAASDTEELTLGASGDASAARGAVLNLQGEDTGGGANVVLTAGVGSNPGDINLTTKAGQDVNVNAANLITDVGNVEAGGDIKITTIGKGLFLKEGANATSGVETLVLGKITVSTTAVTANSRFILSRQNIGLTGGLTIGLLVAVSIVAGTSFDIEARLSTAANGVVGSDVSVVYWTIIEPA